MKEEKTEEKTRRRKESKTKIEVTQETIQIKGRKKQKRRKGENEGGKKEIGPKKESKHSVPVTYSGPSPVAPEACPQGWAWAVLVCDLPGSVPRGPHREGHGGKKALTEACWCLLT